MTETTTKTVSPFWYGTLSALVATETGMSGIMSRAIQGVPTDTPFFVPSEALPRVEKMLVEGNVAHFYGRPVDGLYTVQGPDLRKFALGGEPLPKAERAPKAAPKAEAPVKAAPKAVAKKEPSEAQKAARIKWAAAVKAGREAAKARREAEAQPVAA